MGESLRPNRSDVVRRSPYLPECLEEVFSKVVATYTHQRILRK